MAKYLTPMNVGVSVKEIIESIRVDIKSLLTTLFLFTTFSSCSIYQVDKYNDRQENETIARRLSAPLDKYLVEHSNYPENLEQLLPNYVEQLPTTVSGYEFKYSNLSSYGINEFSIYWYQAHDNSKLINKKIVGCGVNRTRSRNGEFSEINECWRVGQGNH